MKRIFISHSHADAEKALAIASSIEETFGKENVWIDFFDLNGGDDLAGTIRAAIQEANWFVLLASAISMKSRWVQYEARLATFLSIEQQSYRILTVVLDNCEFPRDLDLELRRRAYIDGRNLDANTLAAKVVSDLRKDAQLLPLQSEVFVDRGAEMNALELALHRDKIVHIVGVRGIGKASLVKSVARRFGRTLLRVDLRSGHDLELLSRQLLESVGEPQPPRQIEPASLSQQAVLAVKQAVDRGSALFLNNSENVVDDEGNFRPFFRLFLSQCIAADFSFPVLVAAHHRTELQPEDSRYSTPVKIGRIDDDFMVLAVKKWCEFMRPEAPAPSQARLMEIVPHLNGYPLAAKLIAGYLLFESPQALLRPSFISRFQLQIAEYILGTLAESLISGEREILQAIAVFDAEVDSSTLWQVPQVRKVFSSLDTFQDSLGRLSGMMLVEQDADALRLHPFIGKYFGDQARQKGDYKGLVKSLAGVAWAETRRLLQVVNEIPLSRRISGDRGYVKSSSRLLRAAVPAHRLLLLAGDKDRAKEIPFNLLGHIREMVFEMYQGTRNYEECLGFAEQWLEIEPSDTEVRLYKARALRKLRRYTSALQELARLERLGGLLLSAKILREKGLIADAQGNLAQAIQYFRSGQLRRPDGRPLYSQISIDLAGLLIASADKRPEEDLEARSEYEEAARLLEEAKAFVPRFESMYLGLYVDALYSAGRLSMDRAIEMLNEGLRLNPNDAGIYFRLADILSNYPDRYEEAIRHAEEARMLGLQKAALTSAKILLGIGKTDDAKRSLLSFNPQTEKERVILDVLMARSLRDEPAEATAKLRSYRRGVNPFVDHALIEIELAAANKAAYAQDYATSLKHLAEAETQLHDAKSNHVKSLHVFESLEADLLGVRKRLKV